MARSESAGTPVWKRLRSLCLMRECRSWARTSLLTLGLTVSAVAGVTAQSNKAAPKNRDLEQSLFFDVRPSGPDQSLSKASEKKADAEAAFMQGLVLEE